jgi:hypothetical protein
MDSAISEAELVANSAAGGGKRGGASSEHGDEEGSSSYGCRGTGVCVCAAKSTTCDTGHLLLTIRFWP